MPSSPVFHRNPQVRSLRAANDESGPSVPSARRPESAPSAQRRHPARMEAQRRAVQLLDLTRRIIDEPDDAAVDELEEELLCRVDECIEEGRDDVLVTALKACTREEDVFSELLNHVEEAAANPVVNFAGRVVDAQLLCIPVVLNVPGDARVGGRFPLSANFAAFCSSLKSAGLVPEGSHVCVPNYLYHSRELAELAPSRVSRLAQCLLDEAARCEGLTRRQLGRRGWPTLEPLPPGAATIALGYLVAVVLEDPKARRIPAESNVLETERNAQLADQWRESAAPLVAAALNLPTGAARVMGCEQFHQGLRHGLRSFLEMGLECELSSELLKREMSPKALSVVISAYGEGNHVTEVRVAATSRLDGELIIGHVVPVAGAEEALEAFRQLSHCLQAAGVDELITLPYVLQMESEGEQARVFLTTVDVDVQELRTVPLMPSREVAARYH